MGIKARKCMTISRYAQGKVRKKVLLLPILPICAVIQQHYVSICFVGPINVGNDWPVV